MLFPNAVRIPADILDSPQAILRKLPKDLDAFAFHLPLTRTRRFPLLRSDLCSALRRKGIRLINALATDISKSKIQATNKRAQLPSVSASRRGDPSELLIIKSDLNYGGEAERHLSKRQRHLIRSGSQSPIIANSRSYVVVRREDIQPDWWNMPGTVIERYVSNNKHRFYRVYVGGNSVAISKVIDPSVLKKMPEGIPRRTAYVQLTSVIRTSAVAEISHSIYRLVKEFLRAFPLEFGALDVVQNDNGEFFVIDVNTTPHWGDSGHPRIRGFLANGVALQSAK